MSLLRRHKPRTAESIGAADQRLVAGEPGRCPACGGFGFIDRIDMINRFQIQHCPDCRHRWEYTFDHDGVIIDLTDDAASSTDD